MHEKKGWWCLWSIGVSEFMCVSVWAYGQVMKLLYGSFFYKYEKNPNLIAIKNYGHSLQLELDFCQKT